MAYGFGLEKEDTRGKVIYPGLPILPEGLERYTIPGGGSLSLKISQNDQIKLIDCEGLQPAELVLFNSNGIGRAKFFGVRSNGKATGLQEILRQNETSAQYVLANLQKLGFDLGNAEAVKVFGEGSTAGSEVNFVAECDGWLLIGAPGKPMLVEGTNPLSELVLYLKRVAPIRGKVETIAPPPLADTIIDLNIQPGSGQEYSVKKNQYIQILDVKGRECSDFQAFDIRALDRGIEREIDPTATRSMTGSLYPVPGLYSKYFTVDNVPLLEIIQDTCGRHDTFGVACTARYYEDVGYPGHLNCSDNINIALDGFGIKPRKAWPAINFFFNTMLDHTNTIASEDPWSRPGDFVMLRALTDLVCISTACPCDINPSNGWDPTDIQVRVYNETEDFQRSIGWRKTPEGEVENTKKTAFHDCFSRHTREFVEYNGYWLPNQMTKHGTIAEYWACREKAVIMDLSPLRKYEITGPDSEQLLQLCLTRNMKKLAIGQIFYSAICYDHGGMIDDGTIFRLGDNNFRWVGGTDDSGLWLKKQAKEHNLNVWVKTSTDQLSNLAIQGPLSCRILEQIMWTPPEQPRIDELPCFRFSIARLKGYDGSSCIISRTGYSGELGFEVFCHPNDAHGIFNAIYEVGKPLGLIPLGLAALDMLRIEAGLIFAGYEFSDQTNPFEAGIGFTVPLKSKPDNFIGRDAILRGRNHPKRKLVGLNIEGNQIPTHGDSIYIEKAQVGIITSAMRSPILGGVIALCSIDIIYSNPGVKVQIGIRDGEQKRLTAETTESPHFDPAKSRVKGDYSGALIRRE